jgi:hypothetical protein
MTWYYNSGGQQQGPISDAELASLLATGKITPETLVWREGMKDWQPLATARQAAAPPLLPTGATGAPCVECGRTFPADELVSLNNSLVCAQCKPIYLQRMAEGVPVAGRPGLWREGKKLVTRSENPFPDRCVKCNAPANGFRLKRVLYWQHPAYYLLLLCNLLILLIVVLIVRKKAILHIGLCEAHRKQRSTAIVVCSVGILLGVAMIIGGAVAESGWVALVGVAVFLTGASGGAVKGRTISASKIDKEQTVWVTGVCPAFLDQLPGR